MRILHYNNIDFNIDTDGTVTRRSTWHLIPDDGFAIDSGWTGLREQVELWAGNIGDAWRLPTADSQGYTEDSDYIISGISFNSTARHTYEVSYTGHKKYLTAEIQGGISEHINNSDEHSKSASWLVHADSLSGWLPQIGDVLNWAGNEFICEDIQLQERTAKVWEVRLNAKDTSVMMIGNPELKRNNLHESVQRAKWRVNIASYDSFISTHSINSDASSWAGNDYYITDIQVSPYGKLAYYVTLEASCIETRLLNVKRSEVFNGYDEDGNINKTIVWNGRWRINSGNLSDFENKVGKSAEDWAAPGAIITRVDPIRVTDIIYEVNMEAKVPKDSGDAVFEYNLDDRSNLGRRTDIISKEVDYMLSAGECGWVKNSQGQYEEIPDWDAQKMCPFVTANPLPPEMIEAKLKCVLVSKETFKKGRSKAHVRMNLDWSMTPRLESSVAGISGYWLKHSFDTEELFDSEGKRWTKIIRTYIHAPAGQQWNSNYGGHK